MAESVGYGPSLPLGGGTVTGPIYLPYGTVGATYAKFVSAAGVGNGADATHDALWTLTAIPANTFTANGDALVLTLTGATAATANNKSWGLTVGGTQISSANVAWNNISYIQIATITRVDSTHVNVALMSSSVYAASFNLAVADLTANTLAVVVTGASPTTSAANDVKLYSGFAVFVK